MIMEKLDSKKILLRKVILMLDSQFDAGNSNFTEEDLDTAIEAVSILNTGVKRISKSYACNKILHCSPATFDNYVRMGIIPLGHKDIGFNELSWSINDFKNVEFKRLNYKSK